ncbi:S8 family serine peptidase [Allostreptomyces psammosilenae]|uniref:Subtilisin family serine protease n=1 Tax=Allostreptomyces psammosilenae TaxID=1892865 RepID=A0A852ZKY0_9ACTN|nr:S8 family serine peptidase [Allostreptomyces psammosilenae]NYI03069.1 subtilisin family serine protease [Allostreptomyces psammosilenae]
MPKPAHARDEHRPARPPTTLEDQVQHREREEGAAVLLRTLLAVLACAALLTGSAQPQSEPAYLSYLVVTAGTTPAELRRAEAEVERAGGRVGARYPEFGVLTAYSAAPGFADELRRRAPDTLVGATRTRPMAPPTLPDGSADGAPIAHVDSPPGPLPALGSFDAAQPAAGAGADPAPGPAAPTSPTLPTDSAPSAASADSDEVALVPDPREAGLWNIAMVGGGRPPADPEALAATTVAVLDSGVDDIHPDLRGVVDPALSVSCGEGWADTSPGAWRPDPRLLDSGHGTHVAGTIAARADGKGVVGVAPGVRVAAVRLLGSAGQYYAENIVCGFAWVARHHIPVVNDSYFADPWKYNCPHDPDQAAVIAAVGRAVRFAQDSGALVIASAGNDGQDLRAARLDDRSPNDRLPGTEVTPRLLGTECVRLPGELPGVVRVAAVDRLGRATAYSNHGMDAVEVAAPGGTPGAGPDGAIVSAWPGGRWAALAGTSMSAAHVSAAAALQAAAHPQADPAERRAMLLEAARPPSCAKAASSTPAGTRPAPAAPPQAPPQAPPPGAADPAGTPTSTPTDGASERADGAPAVRTGCLLDASYGRGVVRVG